MSPPKSTDPTSDQVEEIRLCIYRSFAGTGRLPSPADLRAVVEHDDGAVTAAIGQLAANRHVALDGKGTQVDNIVLAHPFASRSFGFSVMSAGTLWWGGCAWDSFALPHLVDCGDVLVATQCPGCDKPLAWVVGRSAPPAGDEVAHFLVPAGRIWDDVVHSCAHQRLFCSDACIDEWLATHDRDEGYRLSLETLWTLASHWYDGRLDRGYQRRDPATAKEYLRSVGLAGPFWGL